MSGKMTQTAHFDNPAWFDGKKINETMFCEEFLREYPMVTVLKPTMSAPRKSTQAIRILTPAGAI